MTYELDNSFFEITSCEAERSALTSVHALARVMQRFDVTEKRALRIIKCARKNGRLMDDLPLSKQREYVKRHKILMDNGYSRLRVYRDFLFVFAPTEQLITAYALPKSFYKQRRFDNKKQVIRDFNKYNRMFPEYAALL